MIGACCLLVSIFAQAPAGELIWPLDLPRVVTGSFGEYRPDRFHVGIDLRTGGNGHPVKAVMDGHVSRVRCSPGGYGKAIYVTFENGYSAVHAHLDGYADALAAYVREEQHRQESYEVDLQVEAGKFPVKRGEVIGFSGDSGTSAPHLHWEWRDPQGRPCNPRAVGLDWPDKVAPTLHKILLVPDAPGAIINGDYLPVTLTLSKDAQGTYRAVEATARGRVGIAIDLTDEAGAYKLGPYRMRLLQGETEVFRVQHDVLSYEELGDGAVCWLPIAREAGRFLACFRWPGNDSESYAITQGDGYVSAGGEPVELTLEVEDAHANISRVPIRLTQQTYMFWDVPPMNRGTGSVSYDWHGLYHTVTVDFSSDEAEVPVVSVEPRGAAELSELIHITGAQFRASFRATGTRGFRIRVQHPRISGGEDVEEFQLAAQGDAPLEISAHGLTMAGGAGAVYGTLAGTVAPLLDAPATDGLRLLGTPVLVEPLLAPLDTALRVSLPSPAEKAERVGVYRWNGGWSFLGVGTSAETQRLGAFVLAEDVSPPSLNWQAPTANYKAQTRRPHVRVELRELGSGLASYELRCGGKWLLAEFDPKQSRLVWLRDEDLAQGEQELTASATDSAGNVRTVSRVLTIP